MFDTLYKSGVAIAAAGILFLSGCGGGGGSGGGSDGGSDGGGSGGGTTSLPTANATAENGAEAVAVIFSGEIDKIPSPFSAAAASQPTGFDPAYFMLDKNGPVSKVLGYRPETLNETLTDSVECDYGGTMSWTGSYTETHMDATVTFSNCAFEENVVMNGKMRLITAGTNYGETVTYEEVSFPSDFTITDDMSTFYISAGSNMRADYSVYNRENGYYAGTAKSSVQWGVDQYKGRYDNLTEVVTEDYGKGLETYCYKSGRIYVDNLTASLDIDPTYDPKCSDPFRYEDLNLVSGSMRFIGSDGYIDASVTDTNTITVTDQRGTNKSVTLW